MNTPLKLSVVALAWVSSACFAQVKVSEPWVRGTVVQQSATGAFMRIESAQDTKLVKAESPVAGVVEVHEMAMEGSVMKMRAVTGGLPLPAGQAVELKPGGFHIMLMDLKKKPLSAGESVPLTLTVQDKDGKQQTLEVQAPVRTMTPGSAKPMTHQH